MRVLIRVAVLTTAAATAAGCGNSPALNTAPLTGDQKQQVRQEDTERDAEEGGFGRKAKSAKRG
ncbi:MAG: hypothetical protein K2X87_05880 [Gemmataceae bacterium]|nr:hypothetical protein [Gemmataceae bacterium]